MKLIDVIKSIPESIGMLLEHSPLCACWYCRKIKRPRARRKGKT